MRLIDAEALEEILRLRRAQCSNDYGSLAGAINGCLKLVQLQPTISSPPNGPLTLEQLDPIENNQGTPLEGLDAFQRQLKRFDIPFEKINRTGETEHDA